MIDFARHVADLAPVFTARPGGQEFVRPVGWQRTGILDSRANLDGWQEGEALCAVLGLHLAVVDVDPRNGGDVELMHRALDGLGVRVYAEVATPGGGRHFYVAGHRDLPTCHDLLGYPGVDVQSHGSHVFLPGTRRPKYDGAGYEVVHDDLEALADGGDPDGAAALVGWVDQRRPQQVEPFAVSPPWDGRHLDGREAAYLRSVTRNAYDKVLKASPGTRNAMLYEAALACGNFVAGAGLNEQVVIDSLRHAAHSNGLLDEDGGPQVVATIKSGLRNGKARPRAVPPAPALTVLEPARVVEEGEGEPGYRFTPGGTFILDTAPDPTPLWGRGSEVLLADGEALIIAGAQGLGKTTLGQQLALGRCGFPEYTDLLGYPVAPGAGRVLYLAMDRPKQAARSFRRMVGTAWRSELDDRLLVWQGPPPYDLAQHTSLLLHLCQKAEADTVVLDSLKDAAVGLKEDEVGAGYNRARQHAVAHGVQIIELHHVRKGDARTLDDLYGSTWLASGAGSVLLLSGNPGDPIVTLRHVKQPAEEVGPMQVMHDHDTGRSTSHHEVDLLVLAKRPVSAVEVAKAKYGTVTPGTKEKARRALNRLTDDGRLRVVQEGEKASSTPTLWQVV